MKILLDHMSNVLTDEQKTSFFSVAREWVDGDVIREGAPDYVDFGEKNDITSREWDLMKEQMIKNFETTDCQLKRF